MKMDVVPGRDNHFEVTPTREGTFAGKCAELCGAYHSPDALQRRGRRAAEEYDAYLQDLRTQGNIGRRAGCSAAPDACDAGRSRRVRVEEESRVTATAARPRRRGGAAAGTLGQQVVRVLTTTDHKLIGKLYLGTSFVVVPRSAA